MKKNNLIIILVIMVTLLMALVSYSIISHKTVQASANLKTIKYPYILPDLPYKYNSLQPYIDALTMEVHHNGHHKNYVANLNKALENYPELQKKTLIELISQPKLLPKEVRAQIINNGGGHWNHSMFWTVMSGNNSSKEPIGELKIAIDKKFGSFNKFKELFIDAAKNLFGSGWAWLGVSHSGDLQIDITNNQDTLAIKGLEPVLLLDVWEHAYYLKYTYKRPEYIENWFNIINWEEAENYYQNGVLKTKK